jgi:cob(I)alamin adenosyltransferase
MKIYTRTGDKGETGLFGGERVLKDSPYVEAYGTVDELNSVLGLAVSFITDTQIRNILENIQSELFKVGADLATPFNQPKLEARKPIPRIVPEQITRLEEWIDQCEAELVPLTRFILPGGTPGAAYLHFARTVSRRAERRVVTLAQNHDINKEIIKYLNRLSDLLFVLARLVNQRAGQPETIWEP